MKAYSQVIAEHLRLTVLRILSEDPDYTMSQGLLVDLVVNYGFNPSADALRGCLAWLTEQGLVTTDESGEILLATLTQRGLDVAQGRAVVPGVKRPAPLCLGGL